MNKCKKCIQNSFHLFIFGKSFIHTLIMFWRNNTDIPIYKLF